MRLYACACCAPSSRFLSLPADSGGGARAVSGGRIDPKLLDDLVAANRILAIENVVDGYGHVSMRHPENPNRYFIARSIAPETVTRLLDMGMDPFNFADALLGILAQRLAKRLCSCKEAYEPSADELRLFVAEYTQELAHTPAWTANPEQATQELLAQWQHSHGVDGRLKLYRAKGCDICRSTGYKGRVGLHELLVADDTTRQLIQERARVATLFTACLDAGMRSLKMDGMEKVLMGLTDLKQVRTVCIK